MAGGGYFLIYRDVFDHSIFAPEPYTEREAWFWIIQAAAWEPCSVRVGSTMVKIKRGELIHSTRFMARKWRWTDSRVRRFLKRLQSDAMIDARTTQQATQKTTHLTICNYDKYQNQRRTNDAASDAENDAASDAKKKELKELKEKKVGRASRLPDDWQPNSDTVFWCRTKMDWTTQRLETTIGSFKDYWHAESGQRSRKLDWNKAFKVWCRREGKNPKPNGKQGWGEAAKEMMDEERHSEPRVISDGGPSEPDAKRH